MLDDFSWSHALQENIGKVDCEEADFGRMKWFTRRRTELLDSLEKVERRARHGQESSHCSSLPNAKLVTTSEGFPHNNKLET